ncbi:MAG: DUF4287 domain-containing protein [Balneolaceae bacterium]|nr:DUF4287 domain-containing protein [Balneolaceae bacterium]
MDQQLQTMINNMPEKTGKSLDEWKSILKEKSFAKHGEALNYLKKEHGVSHGFANTIVHLSKNDEQEEVDLVEAQFKGKENLRPIYERFKTEVLKIGDDITVVPKKTTVSFVRKKQFALFKPATKTRVDLGLKLKDHELTNRLENSGPFGSMCTHRVRIEQTDEIDSELLGWIKQAYDAAG